jgi:hypothetical protein
MISQTEVAELLETPPQNISQIRRGETYRDAPGPIQRKDGRTTRNSSCACISDAARRENVINTMHPVLRYVNQTLLARAMRKFKRFATHKIRASQFLQRLARETPDLLIHWRLGFTSTFA